MEIEVKRFLKTKFIGRNTIFFEEIDSTQIQAKKFAENRVANGSIVLTENQTSGLGTHGRKWYSEQNKNVAFTIILYPKCELKKLNKADCIDLAKPTDDMKGISVIKSTPRITKKELNEYVEHLKEYYDVKYYEDIYDWTHSYVQDDSMITMPREKGNEKLIRTVFVDNNKNFPIKDAKGKVRGKLGAVSYREKGVTDKNELDDYFEEVSDLVLYKQEQTEDKEEISEE